MLVTLNAQYMPSPTYTVHYIDQTTNYSEPKITDAAIINHIFGKSAPSRVYGSIIPHSDFLVALNPLVNDQQFILITSDLE